MILLLHILIAHKIMISWLEVSGNRPLNLYTYQLKATGSNALQALYKLL